MSKGKNNGVKVRPSVAPANEALIAEEKFFNLPTSPATETLLKVMGAGSELAQLPEAMKNVNHGQTIEVLQNGQKRQVIVTSGASTVTVELADIDKLLGSNKPAKKMFVLALIKANEQALINGTLRKNYIQFPLKELVDIGYYSQPRSARTGFDSAMDTLTSLKIKGSVKKGKRKIEEQARGEVLFTGWNRENGICTIFLNERINWAFIATFYTILPKYYFSLPNRASDLLYYIFYLARQNVKEIEQKGYFNIGMRAIQSRLNLPDETVTKNPDRDIRQAIDEAVTSIEEASKDLEFTITPIYEEGSPISEFLNSGYLKIELSGNYAKDFIKLSKETAKQIATKKNRDEKIVERARAINLAKTLENDASQ